MAFPNATKLEDGEKAIQFKETKSLTYQYDDTGKCVGFIYDDGSSSQTYYYLYNLQGDVTAIFDASGNAVVKYTYDAWDKIVSITDGSGNDVSGNADHIGNVNPIRYKGYYYDAETGYYYLSSRYYDIRVCRFLNADLYVSTGQGFIGHNMFAYCLNNPINLFDYTGELPQAIVDKIVHNEVLRHICMLYADLSMSKTCIYYNGVNARAGWGFCDLYNTKTGEVWELKKNSTSVSCQTYAATEQLNRYVNGNLKHSPELDLKKPYITNIRSGNFTFTSNGYIYDVSFWNEGNGILRYDYTREKTDKRKNAELAIGVIAVVVVSGFPTAIPVVVAGGAGCIIVG